jgi:hypothetical protein
MILEAGKTYTVENYPFVRGDGSWSDELGPIADGHHWRPGLDDVMYGPEGETYPVYDGLGKQLLSIVSIHKPGRYPERVFYTRQWVDPDGKVFGKHGLKVAVAWRFKQLASGYRHDGYQKPTLREGQS